MTPHTLEFPRSVLFALAIAVVGAVASFALWRAVESRQSAEIERNSAAFASLLAKLLQVRIDEHELGALRRWVAWAQQESIDSALWRAEARRFLSEHPAYAAIVRIDRGRQSDVLHASESGAAVLELVEQLEQRPADGPDGDTVLVRLPDGRAALAVPIPFRGGNTQLVFALLEPDVALRGMLDEAAMGYSVRVGYGSDDLADAEGDLMPPAHDRFWRSQSVVLSTGTPLTVRVRPTALLTGSLSDEGPAFVLSAGLAITALTAALAHARWPGRRRAAAPAIAMDEAWGRGEPGVHDEETSRVRRSLESRERTLALQRTVEQLETMNMSVSHDLRSPLGAVINFATILSSKYANVLDAPANDYLRRISSNAKRAVTLVDGLLEFSRSGREEIHKGRVDMRRLVEGVCDDLIGGTERGSLVITDLPAAYADPEMMRRVFTNLISNARKFVAAGASPRVTIGGARKGGELVYFVRDQGIGFDMHSVDRLFNEFGRLHVSAFEGHGIGLAIVARLVRRHGGRVWAHGAKGRGATFLFSLPLPPPGSLDLDVRERNEDRIEGVSGLVALDLHGSAEIGSGVDRSSVEAFTSKEIARC